MINRSTEINKKKHENKNNKMKSESFLFLHPNRMIDSINPINKLDWMKQKKIRATIGITVEKKLFTMFTETSSGHYVKL